MLKKKYLGSILAALMAFVFVACSSPAGSDNSNSGSDKDPIPGTFLKYDASEGTEDYISIDLSTYTSVLKKADTFYIYRKPKAQNSDIYNSVMSGWVLNNKKYLSETDLPKAIPDLYTEPGIEYCYFIRFCGPNDYYYTTAVESLESIDGLGELTITPGAGDYDETSCTINFTTKPKINGLRNLAGFSAHFDIYYKDSANNEIGFDLSITEANTSINIVEDVETSNFGEREITPSYWWFQTGKNVGNAWVRWTARANVEPGELPSFKTPKIDKTFVKICTDDEDSYRGYVEFDFTDYLSKIDRATGVNIFRKEYGADTSTERLVLQIYSYDGSTIKEQLASQKLHDFYTEPNKKYEYYARFHDSNWDFDYGTGWKEITPEAGLGEISITPGRATFDVNTGNLEFTKIPKINIPSPEKNPFAGLGFTEGFYLVYRCYNNSNNYDEISFGLSEIENYNPVNLYDLMILNKDYELMLGKKNEPGYYWWQSYIYDGPVCYKYAFDYDIIDDSFPTVTLPAEIPARN